MSAFLSFNKTETTLGYMRAHGVPAALYIDRHSIFHINAKDANAEAETQFARAARELGIECIPANTPASQGEPLQTSSSYLDSPYWSILLIKRNLVMDSFKSVYSMSIFEMRKRNFMTNNSRIAAYLR